MAYEDLIARLNECAGAGYKHELLGEAAVALGNVNKRNESNARIIHDLQLRLHAAWTENEALKKRLKEAEERTKNPVLEGYA